MSLFKSNFYYILKKYFWFGAAVLSIAFFSFILLEVSGEKKDKVSAVGLNLPIVSTDAKTKIIYAPSLSGDKYYVAFSSSTAEGLYRMYVTYSADGSAGSWSEPVDIFGEDIGYPEVDEGEEAASTFAFARNGYGLTPYLGAAIYASSTNEIWFASSTDGVTWSATSSISLSEFMDANSDRYLDLDFPAFSNMAVLTYNYSHTEYKVSFSTDNGGSWTDSGVLNVGDGGSYLIGGKVHYNLMTGASFRFAYSKVNYISEDIDKLDLIYAISDDAVGTSWTTSTIISDIGLLTTLGDEEWYSYFDELLAFNLDSNGVPSVIYYDPEEFEFEELGEDNYNIYTTSTVKILTKGNEFWVSSNITLANIYPSGYIGNRPVDLIFVDLNKPIFFGQATSSLPAIMANQGSGWVELATASSIPAELSKLSVTFNSSAEKLAYIYVDESGQIIFGETNWVREEAPSSPSDPSDFATTTITATSIGLSWTDNSDNETGFKLYISTDGVDYEESLLGENITSTTVSDLTANTAYWFRVLAYNDSGDSSYVSLDEVYTSEESEEEASVPTSVLATANSATQITVSWSGDGAAYYVENITISTNSGWIEETSFAFIGLTCGTSYTFKVKARNASEVETVYSSTASATTNNCPSSGGGGGSAVTIIPSGTGTGSNDINIGMNQIGSLGNLNSGGINFLGYVGSQAYFNTLVSSAGGLQNHSLKINNLDLLTKKINLIIQSELQEITLGLGEIIKVDLDKDGVEDLEVKFAGLWVNRAELTVKSILDSAEGSLSSDVAASCPSSLFVRNLNLGSIGEDVRFLQQYLNNNGFLIANSGVGSKGRETNYFGLLTKQALTKFQQAKKINATLGSFDLATRNYFGCVSFTTPSVTAPSAKYNFNNFLNFGMSGAEVKQLQLRLQELGYLAKDVTATGYFGPLTRTAVIKLQLEYNLQPSAGFVGPGTRGILNK